MRKNHINQNTKRETLNDNQYSSDIILILTYGRAGSYFIQSLLDSHPELICFPPMYTSAFIQEIDKKNLDISNANAAYDTLMAYNDGFMLGKTEHTNNHIAEMVRISNLEVNIGISLEAFKTKFLTFYEQVKKETSDLKLCLVKTMSYAFDAAINDYEDIDIAKQKKILFQCHRVDYTLINWFSEQFDHLDLLHMLRSPLTTLCSSMRYSLKLDKDGIATFSTKVLENYLKFLFFTGDVIAKPNISHFGVRLEFLHQQPNLTLEKLAKRLNISFHENLLTSTFGGKDWTNFEGKEHLSLFNPDHVREGTLIDDITPYKDAAFLGLRLKSKYDHWHYQHDFPGPSRDTDANHFLLVEYLAVCKDMQSAEAAYAKQQPIYRSREMQFFFDYACSHQQNLIEVL